MNLHNLNVLMKKLQILAVDINSNLQKPLQSGLYIFRKSDRNEDSEERHLDAASNGNQPGLR